MAQCNCNPLEVQLEALILGTYPQLKLEALPQLVVEILKKTDPEYSPYKDCQAAEEEKIYNIRITPAGLDALVRLFNEGDVRSKLGDRVTLEPYITVEDVRLDFQLTSN